MAETTKKLVDLDLLKYYDGKVVTREDTKDAAVLEGAKGYTDTEIGKVNTAAEALAGRVTAVETKASANETAIGVLNGDETVDGSVKKTVADKIAEIVANAPEDFDTLKEISDWIAGHADSAAEMNTAISDNTKAIDALEALVGTLPEGVTATDVIGYIQEAVAAEKARAEGIEGGLDERLTELEGAVGETGSVATAIETAKNEAIAAAKEYSDGLDTAMDERVDALEADNTANKAAIEAINNAETGIIATAETYTDSAIDALSQEGGAIKTLADKQDSYETEANARLDALESATGSFASTDDIDSLFTTV